MGFDWKFSTATIGALAAKEVFVAQLGILHSRGEVDEETEKLRAVLRRHYTPLQAFCMMLFSLLSIPCLATLVIIKRELNSWKMAILEGGRDVHAGMDIDDHCLSGRLAPETRHRFPCLICGSTAK